MILGYILISHDVGILGVVSDQFASAGLALDLRITPARRLPPRPRRWAAAIATLIGLQDEYRAWLDSLPDNLEGSRLADKLQTIAELDLEELQAIDPPRGYGRD